FGLEADVDRAHDVHERVAALDAAPQRALEDAQTRRQVEAGRVRRDFGGAAELGPALARRSDRTIEGDWRHQAIAAVLVANIPKGPVTACHAVTSDIR